MRRTKKVIFKEIREVCNEIEKLGIHTYFPHYLIGYGSHRFKMSDFEYELKSKKEELERTIINIKKQKFQETQKGIEWNNKIEREINKIVKKKKLLNLKYKYTINGLLEKTNSLYRIDEEKTEFFTPEFKKYTNHTPSIVSLILTNDITNMKVEKSKVYMLLKDDVYNINNEKSKLIIKFPEFSNYQEVEALQFDNNMSNPRNIFIEYTKLISNKSLMKKFYNIMNRYYKDYVKIRNQEKKLNELIKNPFSKDGNRVLKINLK